MGKVEIEMRIKLIEQMMEKYLELSEMSVANERKYKATIEKFRITLASLYLEKEKQN